MTKKNYIAISIISLFLLTSCAPVLMVKGFGSKNSQDKTIPDDSSGGPYNRESKE